MSEKRQGLKLILLILSLLGVMTMGGCAAQSAQSGANFDSAYQKDVRPYGFNYAAWEARTFGSMLKQKLSSPAIQSANETQTVFNYFQTISRLEQN